MSNASMPMPQYQCHKKVWALKISGVSYKGIESPDLLDIVEVSFEGEFAPRVFNLSGKPRPEAGWYFVNYESGYCSFSPAKEFEDGYTLIA